MVRLPVFITLFKVRNEGRGEKGIGRDDPERRAGGTPSSSPPADPRLAHVHPPAQGDATEEIAARAIRRVGAVEKRPQAAV